MVRIFTVLAAVAAMSTSVAAQTPVKTKAKAEQSGDAIVCKRFAETGSLIAQRKVCKSRADWDRERAETAAGWVPKQSCSSLGSGTNC